MSEIIDNKAHRVRTLKHIIKHLHAGQAPEQVKQQMKDLVRQTDYAEIMAMEQELISEGMPVDEVRSMCDLHSQVTRDVMVQIKPRHDVGPGHPVDTFRRENKALSEVIDELRKTMQKASASADAAGIVTSLKSGFNSLMDVDKHYQRKEHALFSCLERHGITGPSKVMWAKDDDARALLKEFGSALSGHADVAEWKTGVFSIAERAISAIAEMIYKEENILLPMALDTLTEEEWAEIWSVSPRYGWCLVEPLEGYTPPVTMIRKAMELPNDGVIMLPTGNVTV